MKSSLSLLHCRTGGRPRGERRSCPQASCVFPGGVDQRKLHVLLLYGCGYNSDRKISLQRYLRSNIDYLAARCQSCCWCLSQTAADQGRKMMLSPLYPWWTIPNDPARHLPLLHFLVAERCRLTLQNAWSYSERNKQSWSRPFAYPTHSP